MIPLLSLVARAWSETPVNSDNCNENTRICDVLVYIVIAVSRAIYLTANLSNCAR
jgi:hypothetical protein